MAPKSASASSWTVAKGTRNGSRKAKQEAAQKLDEALTASAKERRDQACVSLNEYIPGLTNRVGSTERNSETAPLLRLPGELRNKIYKHALGHQFEWQTEPLRPFGFRDGRNLSLLRVCRQIHHETRLLPYTLSTLRVTSAIKRRIFTESITTDHHLSQFEAISCARLGTILFKRWLHNASRSPGICESLDWLESLPNIKRIEVAGCIGVMSNSSIGFPEGYSVRDHEKLGQSLLGKVPKAHIVFEGRGVFSA